MLVSLEERLHVNELLAVLLEHIGVLLFELVANSGSRVHIIEAVEELEGSSSRVELSRESLLDKSDCLFFDLVHVGLEVLEGGIPVSGIFRKEDVVEETRQLEHVIVDLLADVVNLGSATSDSGEVVTEDGVELLDHLAGRLQVLEDEDHVLWLLKDLLLVSEVPSHNSVLILDLLTSSCELRVPLVEHGDTRIDVSDLILLLLLEDGLDVDLQTDLLANLI